MGVDTMLKWLTPRAITRALDCSLEEAKTLISALRGDRDLCDIQFAISEILRHRSMNVHGSLTIRFGNRKAQEGASGETILWRGAKRFFRLVPYSREQPDVDEGGDSLS